MARGRNANHMPLWRILITAGWSGGFGCVNSRPCVRIPLTGSWWHGALDWSLWWATSSARSSAQFIEFMQYKSAQDFYRTFRKSARKQANHDAFSTGTILNLLCERDQWRELRIKLDYMSYLVKLQYSPTTRRFTEIMTVNGRRMRRSLTTTDLVPPLANCSMMVAVGPFLLIRTLWRVSLSDILFFRVLDPSWAKAP